MATKSAILDRTEQLVKTDGLAELSISKIARAVGIRKASLFYHFTSKSNLLTELFNRYAERLFTDLDNLAERDISAAQKLGSYFSKTRQIVAKENSICLSIVFCTAEGSIDEQLAAKLVEFQDYNIAWLEAVFSLGNRDASTKRSEDTNHDAIAVLAATDGAQIMAKSHRDLAYFDAVIDRLKLQHFARG